LLSEGRDRRTSVVLQNQPRQTQLQIAQWAITKKKRVTEIWKWTSTDLPGRDGGNLPRQPFRGETGEDQAIRL